MVISLASVFVTVGLLGGPGVSVEEITVFVTAYEIYIFQKNRTSFVLVDILQ